MSYSPPELPPPPPRPNHGRSLSNISTSSSASSSPTKSNTSSIRANPRNLSLDQYMIGSGGLARSYSLASHSPTKSTGGNLPLSRRSSLSPTSTRRQLAHHRESASTSSPTQTLSRSRTSSIVDKLSTSPTHARYSSLPGAGSFAKIPSPARGIRIGDIPEEKNSRNRVKQLPSPPNTSSDGTSNGGGLAGLKGRKGEGSQEDLQNAGNSDVFSTIPNRSSITNRQELSPSTTVSSRPSQKSTQYSSRGPKLLSGSSTPPALTARNLKTSTSFFSNALTSPDPNSSASESETRTLRLVESRTDLGQVNSDQSNIREEERSARKARRSLALKDKNQLILDAINMQPIPSHSSAASTSSLASPSRSNSLSLSRDDQTSTSLRSYLDEQPSASRNISLTAQRSPTVKRPLLGKTSEESLQRTVRSRASVNEFGRFSESPIGRRETVSNSAVDHQTERRVRTLGAIGGRNTGESRERNSPARGGSDPKTEDAPSSMNSTRVSPSARRRTAIPQEFVQSTTSRTTMRNGSLSPGADLSPRSKERFSASRTTSPSPSTISRQRLTPELSNYSSRRQHQSESSTSNSLSASRNAEYSRSKKSSEDSLGGTETVGSATVSRSYRNGSRDSTIDENGGDNGSERSISRASRLARRLESSSPMASGDVRRRGSEDVFRNGLDYPGTVLPSRTALGEFDNNLKSSEVVSDTWLQDFQDLRQRNSRSRASGSFSSISSQPPPPLPHTPRDNDRVGTIRALNAVLAAQGLVVTAAPHPQTAPSKLQPSRVVEDDSRRRTTSATTPMPSTLRMTPASTSRLGAESSRSVRTTGSSTTNAEHHKLLIQAFDHFDLHFTPIGDRENLAPASVELVHRMAALVQATTKINNGIRALALAATEAQIDAALDESKQTTSQRLSNLEKGVSAIVRSSNDQVRSLTEGLIAFTKVERERDKLRTDGDLGPLRPASRLSVVRGQPSPRAGHTYEGSTGSNSVSRSTTSASTRQTLRNPLEEPSRPYQRASTLSLNSQSPRSPYSSLDSPTPVGRRHFAESSVSSVNTSYDSTASRTPLGLPLPDSGHKSSTVRRSRSSAASNTTLRVGSPSSRNIQFPRSPTLGSVDPTNASTNRSPTKQENTVIPPVPFPRTASVFRAFSDAPQPITEVSNAGSYGHETSYSGSPERERIAPRVSTGSIGLGFGGGLTALRSVSSTLGRTRGSR